MLELKTTFSKSLFTAPLLDTNAPRTINISESDISQQVAPNLAVDFSKDSLNALLQMDGCEAIRLYPAIESDELVMIACGVNDKNSDMTEEENFTYVGYSDHRPTKRLNIDEAKACILGLGASAQDLESLEILQEHTIQGEVFKARFDANWIQATLQDNDIIRFEVAAFNFVEGGKQKTIVATTFSSSTEDNELIASLLPCPPYCTGGKHITASTVLYDDVAWEDLPCPPNCGGGGGYISLTDEAGEIIPVAKDHFDIEDVIPFVGD